MRISKLAGAAMLGLSALALSACATGLSTEVTRYQSMPAPQGQTFYIVPGGGMAANGGLEFQRYAGLVAQQLAVRGYRPTTDMKSANMIVQLGYGIGPGQVRIETDPFYEPWSSFYYPRFGYRSPFYYGWGDPFWGTGFGRSPVNSFVEYQSQIDMHIRAAGTNQALFDGRAQARSSTNRADRVLPPLIEALFTGFPGRSGEDVRITIPARTY